MNAPRARIRPTTAESEAAKLAAQKATDALLRRLWFAYLGLPVAAFLGLVIGRLI